MKSKVEQQKFQSYQDKTEKSLGKSASLINDKNHERAPSLRAHETAVLVWNRFYPIGTPVLVKRDDDSTLATETVSEAAMLGGHTAVVWLKDIRGAYLLDRISPRLP